MYVERGHNWNVRRDINQLACMLDNGFNVSAFPEGTTTNREALLPFKSPLIESALRSSARVMPICLRYETAEKRFGKGAMHEFQYEADYFDWTSHGEEA